MQITISIGRNIGNTPMSDEEWTKFCFNLSTVANDLGHIIVTNIGTSLTDEWGSEESYTVILSTRKRPSMLEERLRRIAHTFHQEAIAVTYHEPARLIRTKRASTN